MRDDWDESDDWPEDDDDESLTVRCPSCGADVYEDAEQCPMCGDYITADTSAWSGRPAWFVVLGLLGVIAVIVALTSF